MRPLLLALLSIVPLTFAAAIHGDYTSRPPQWRALPRRHRSGGKYIFPGSSVHDELSLLVKAGLTPLEALQAATGNAAAALGIDDSGTIRTGNVADLVLLRADPSTDIANTTSIETVFRRGLVLDRQQLDELLRSAAAEAPRR